MPHLVPEITLPGPLRCRLGLSQKGVEYWCWGEGVAMRNTHRRLSICGWVPDCAACDGSFVSVYVWMRPFICFVNGFMIACLTGFGVDASGSFWADGQSSSARGQQTARASLRAAERPPFIRPRADYLSDGASRQRRSFLFFFFFPGSVLVYATFVQRKQLMSRVRVFRWVLSAPCNSDCGWADGC